MSYEQFLVEVNVFLVLAFGIAMIVAYTRPSVRATFERRQAS